MKLSENQNIEDWFLKKKTKDFPNNIDYVNKYIHIRDILKEKIHNNIMTGATVAEIQKKPEQRKTMTGHDSRHFQQLIETTSNLLNTGKNKDVSAYEVFFLLVAIQIHDIGNILGRDKHDDKLAEVFNDLFSNDESIDSVEKNIYLNIAAAHTGEVDGNKDKIRKLFSLPIVHHNGREIKVRFLAALLRFADELAESPFRAEDYLYKKAKAEQASEIYHVYSKSVSSIRVEHSTSTISINYSFDKSTAQAKYHKGNKKVYLLDEIFSRIIKLHYEKIYCQKFFGDLITLDHLNITISIFSDDHVRTLRVIKLRLIEHGYPDYKKAKIENICEDPESTIIAVDNKPWSGKILKDEIKLL